MPARVLVVAAQPAVQLQLGNMLRRDGHDLVVASDGVDGLRSWSTDRPDLIAVDNDLPDVPGLEVVTRIRQSEAPGIHTPIVLLGSAPDVESKVRALRAGADD
ncbi:MAG: response regulator [Candidatus Limnocylindrales bacterium]